MFILIALILLGLKLFSVISLNWLWVTVIVVILLILHFSKKSSSGNKRDGFFDFDISDFDGD